MRLRLLVLVVACATIVSAPASGATWLLTVNGPKQGTVQDLRSGRLKQTVNCKRKCKVTTTLTIKPSVARQLGFSGVKAGQKQWVVVATGSARPKPRTRTTVALKPTAEAKRRLAKARNLGVSVAVRGVALAAPVGNTSIGWDLTLK